MRVLVLLVVSTGVSGGGEGEGGKPGAEVV